MGARFRTGILIAVVLAAGAAGATALLADRGPTADDLAARACGRDVATGGPPPVAAPGVASPTNDTIEEFDAVIANAETSAGLAARAARADARWDALATAYSGRADTLAEVRPIFLRAKSGDITDADNATLERLSENAEFDTTIRAECRKTA